jgi:hypothetical protein
MRALARRQENAWFWSVKFHQRGTRGLETLLGICRRADQLAAVAPSLVAA